MPGKPSHSNSLQYKAQVDDLRRFFTDELMLAMGLQPQAWIRKVIAHPADQRTVEQT